MRWKPLILAFPLLSSASTTTSIEPQSISLVDLLSASPDHSLLLKAFQQARLIPTLNRLNGSTLFAPTNDAIRAHRDREKEEEEGDRTASSRSSSGWDLVLDDDDESLIGEDGRPGHDNLQLELRETLLYHCLNYTLFPPPRSKNSSHHNDTTEPEPVPPPIPPHQLSHDHDTDHLPLDVTTLQETLLFPMLSPFNHSFPAPPSLPGSEPDKPDPGAPTDRPEGLLRGEGQKVRIVKRKVGQAGETRRRKMKKERDAEEVVVGVGWKGQGGFKVDRKVQHAKNGEFVSVDGVLTKPRDLATIIRNEPSLSTFASLLPTQVLDYLSTVSHMTVFAPTNEAWSSLSELEMRYLRSGFAEMDIAEIFGDAASRTGPGKGKVGYLEKLVGEKYDGETNVTTLRNGTIDVAADGSEVKVNGNRVETGDIFAKNGVLHTVPSLLLPSGSLSLTAEKYLIALNCTRFVSLLRSVNLSHYVQVPTEESTFVRLPMIDSRPSQRPFDLSNVVDEDSPREQYTILAITDDVLLPTLSRLGSSFPPPGSQELKRLLSYHIVTGQWTPRQLEDGMLIATELKPRELKGMNQRVEVSVQEEEELGEGWLRKSDSRKGEKEVVIGWGNANAVAEPIVVGGSIIYLISTVLEPPAPVVTAAVSDLRLSTFVAAVYAGALDGTLATQPAVTYLVPTNSAFQALGLVMSYLLLPSAREELRSMLKYHSIDDVVYLQDFPRTGQTSQKYPTLLDGSEIYLGREEVNQTLTVRGPTLGGLPANGEARDARVVEGNILTETGTIHIIDQVELPPDLDVTVEKLFRGAKSTTMVELIKAANLSWVLEGKKPHHHDRLHQREEGSLSSYVDGPDNEDKKHKNRRPNVSRAYTILCPSDKALSRLNLTYYLSNPPALSALVRLHIIPTDALTPGKTYLDHPSAVEDEGTPLVLTDSIKYQTLHSRSEGGKSQFGTVSFRKWGTEVGSWMVGIEGVKGNARSERETARVVAWGRATPWFVEETPDDDLSSSSDRERMRVPGMGSMTTTKLAAGGGVILIDSVLLPYEPGWFRLWGWIVLVVVGTISLVAGIVVFGIKRWRKKSNPPRYEPVEGEED